MQVADKTRLRELVKSLLRMSHLTPQALKEKLETPVKTDKTYKIEKKAEDLAMQIVEIASQYI
jgi:hypothetical protein